MIIELKTVLTAVSREFIERTIENDIRDIEKHFIEKNMSGATDWMVNDTHIQIDKPSTDPKKDLNRKQFYLIEVTISCLSLTISPKLFAPLFTKLHTSLFTKFFDAM